MEKDENANLIKDKTTEFYHLVPHVLKFGETLPVLDREDLIQKKIEIVDRSGLDYSRKNSYRNMTFFDLFRGS